MSQLFYEIEVLDNPIEINGVTHSKSVKIVEFSNHKKIRERYLGWVDRNDLYNSISKEEKLELNDCYVKDFSITEYKKNRGLEDKSKVEIKGLSATNSFFDCNDMVDFSHASFTEDVDFNHTVFSQGTLNFMHATFETDLIDFSSCSFHSHKTVFQYCHFTGELLNFEHARFDGEIVSFINSSLKSETVNFKRVNFNESKVKFHFAEFGDGLKTFEKMKFNGPVLDFRRVIFGSGKVDFRRSLFGSGHITFEESEITSGKMTFRLSKFDGGNLSFRRMDFGEDEVNFDHIDFGNRTISFEYATASTISISNSNIHANLDLRIKRVDTIDLSESYLHSITDLNFLKIDALRTLNIVGVRNLGKIIIDWSKNNVKNLILNQDHSNELLAEQFNIIKDNFTKNGQYSDEDWAYVYFKRYEMNSDKEKALKKSKAGGFGVRFYYAFKSLLFDKMGLFATSPSRVFLSMFVTILGFGMVYVGIHYLGNGEIVNSVGAADNLNIVDKSLYHSAITFFTIGYGDYYPTNWSRLVSAFEGWIGVFLMSYFTVAFVRKILR